MYFNKAIIIGNLTRDPEVRALPSGVTVATIGVATNRIWKDKNGVRQEDTQFHNVVAFGRQAEIINQYLKKGSSILVEGRLQTQSWDAPDGSKRYKTEIVTEQMQLGPRAGGAGGDRSINQDVKGASKEMPVIDLNAEDIKAEDLPF